MQGAALRSGSSRPPTLTRGIQVRPSPDREGAIDLSASVTGPTAGVNGHRHRWVSMPARAELAYPGFGERSDAVDERGNEVEDYVSDSVPDALADRGLIGLSDPGAGSAIAALRPDLLPGPLAALHRRLRGPAGQRRDAADIPAGVARIHPPGASRPRRPTSASRFVGGPAPADALRPSHRDHRAASRAPAGPGVRGPGTSRPAMTARPGAGVWRAADVPGSAVKTYTHYLPCGAQQGETAASARSRAASTRSGWRSPPTSTR